MATKKKSTELTTYLLMMRDGTKQVLREVGGAEAKPGTFQGVKDGL